MHLRTGFFALATVTTAAAIVLSACSAANPPAAGDSGESCSTSHDSPACCKGYGGTPAAANDVCPAGLGLACKHGPEVYPNHCCFPPVVADCNAGNDACAYPPVHNDPRCPATYSIGENGSACDPIGLVCAYSGKGDETSGGCLGTASLSCEGDAGAPDGGGQGRWVATQ